MILTLGLPNWVEAERIDRASGLQVEPFATGPRIHIRTSFDDGRSQDDYFRPDPGWTPESDQDAHHAVMAHFRSPVVDTARVCTSCTAPIGEAARLCWHCGPRQPVSCPQCGTVMDDDDRFCAECGTSRRTP